MPGYGRGGSGRTPADRWRHAQIPFARIVLFERAIGENTSRTNFDEIARELILEHAIFVAPEEDRICHAEGVQIVSAGILPVETYAAITLDAAVHLVIEKRTEILIAESAFLKFRPAVVMAGHHRHVLKMAFAALVAHGAVMRMTQHHSFDDSRAKSHCVRVKQRNPRIR